ncbi:MAG: hypothetical protein ACHQ2Z_02390 [Elusimicrobiota bacterium]
MNFPREWTAFGGASLALMGTAIGAGARRHAEDNLAWRREWGRAAGVSDAGPRDARRLVLALRVGGVVGVLAGLGIVAAAAADRPLTSSHFGPGDARALGACFTLLGACFAVMSLFRRSPRGPRFLAFDPLAAPPVRSFGERVSGAAGWLLIVLWIWFGLRLLRAEL